MKHFPYPDAPLTNHQEMREHIEALVFNAMHRLHVDGYIFYIKFPGDAKFEESKDSGASIIVEFPYKNFSISIQQHSVDQMKSEPLTSPIWKNIESSMIHEVIHILTWRLSELAGRRFTTPTDISEAEEELTDHFTHLIHSYILDHRERETKTPARARAKPKRGATL